MLRAFTPSEPFFPSLPEMPSSPFGPGMPTYSVTYLVTYTGEPAEANVPFPEEIVVVADVVGVAIFSTGKPSTATDDVAMPAAILS